MIGSAEQRDFTLDFLSLGVQQHDLSELEVPFTEEEVWATIREIPLDKAPGPDGFTGRFYKVCWNSIKDDVLAALLAVQRGHVFNFRLINSAFITLVPKKTEALHVKDFRPISLIHSFAKLVAKLLANRLAPHLPKLVTINQSAFVKGRSILDNFLMVQQLARTLHHKEPHVLLKLDISKAFDSVSWAFLLELLQHLGFGRKWCNLISLLLSTSSTRILINGEPGDCISHRRGLRQGDPLSPMLFILVMEVLNSIVHFATQEHLLQPIAYPQAIHRISVYADDVVLFLWPLRSDLSLVTCLLDIFGQSTGLRTNIAKSSVTPIQCGEEELAAILELLPCELKEFPCNYLGLPLTIRKPSKAELQPLIDKVSNKLLGWKASHELSSPARDGQGGLIINPHLLYARFRPP